MWFDLITALRAAAASALPSGVYTTANVLYDALDQDIASSLRAVNITTDIGDTNQVTMGGTRQRHRCTGVLYVRLYEPSGLGDGTQLAHATTISNALRGLAVSKNGVTARLGSPTLVNGQREGSKWVRIVQVPFKADGFFQVTV